METYSKLKRKGDLNMNYLVNDFSKRGKVFATLNEANAYCNMAMKKTGYVFSVNETKRKITHEYDIFGLSVIDNNKMSIEKGLHYEIFYNKKNNLYFFDNYVSGTCHGFYTLIGAKESAYYAELRETKN